jgi:hypothetical protein
MAATATAASPATANFGSDVQALRDSLRRNALRRRRISPRAGRALEILGHAIDYLSDEFAHSGGSLSAHGAQVEAVQLLMQINREIYLECPAVPSAWERWRSLLGLPTA